MYAGCSRLISVRVKIRRQIASCGSWRTSLQCATTSTPKRRMTPRIDCALSGQTGFDSSDAEESQPMPAWRTVTKSPPERLTLRGRCSSTLARRSRPALRRPARGSLRRRASWPRIGRSTGRSSAPRPGGCCGGCAFRTAARRSRRGRPCGLRLKNCSTSLAHFGRQLRARFVQAQHDARQLQPVVEPLVHEADRFRAASLRPCSARKCGCSGRNTSSTAASALIVRMPSDGGQSMRT